MSLRFTTAYFVIVTVGCPEENEPMADEIKGVYLDPREAAERRDGLCWGSPRVEKRSILTDGERFVPVTAELFGMRP